MTDDDDTVNMDDGTYMLPARGVHRGGGGGGGGFKGVRPNPLFIQNMGGANHAHEAHPT